MADNSELLALAARLDQDADEIRALVGPVRAATGPGVLAGGRLADSVDELIEVSATAAADVAAELEAVAGALRAIDVVDVVTESAA